MNLDDLLEKWTVFEPGTWDNETGPGEWYAVANETGIVAYFASCDAAYRFRLSEINRELNG